MGLAETVAEATWRRDSLVLGLAGADRKEIVQVPGYVRLVPQWRLDRTGARLEARPTFGPFRGRTSVAFVMLIEPAHEVPGADGSEPVRVAESSRLVRLADLGEIEALPVLAGMTLTTQVEIAIVDVEPEL